MALHKLELLKEGQEGYGLLVEWDAGSIEPSQNKHLINESFTIDPNKPIIVKCILQKHGIKNKNKRIYPKDVLIPETQRYDDNYVKTSSAISEADHPDSSVVSLLNISHIIRKMWWDGNVLYGELEIITSPAYMSNGIVCMIGDKIVEYLKRGVRLGISSRGIGSVKNVNGDSVVQNDFELIGFDLVHSPSTPGAYLITSTDIPENYKRATIETDGIQKESYNVNNNNNKHIDIMDKLRQFNQN
jgi:hypothetical protein